jgi:CubicO group peptidase (beta-lactamase class C family)
LTHTSGIPDTIGTFHTEEITSSLPLEQTIADAKAKPLDFQPGEKWSYNNTGYNLLGKIIEAASGESYESFLQKNIFEPLEMSSTGYDLGQSDLAVGYPDQFNAAHEINLWVPFSAGGLYSTAEDLYRWDQALYTDRLVSQKTLGTIFTAQVQIPDSDGQGYGYGWMTMPTDQGYVVFHPGGIEGFTSFIGRYLDAKATIIILTNQGNVDPSVAGDLIYKKLFGAK